METPEAKTILITDDNYDILLVTSMRLKEKGYKVLTAIDGVEALKIVETEAVDLVILDISMPNMDGMEVCRRIKANKNIPYIPIVFFTAKDSVEEKVKGMKMGVADYITKPVDHRELIARVEMVLENSAIQEKISYKDEITGLSNYNFFKKQLNYHYEISKRYGRIFSLLVLDVDKFKSINDTQGHLCGNIVLKTIAGKLQDLLRKADIITRYGGDEFAVILPETNADQTKILIERMKEKLGAIEYEYEEKTGVVSLSFGFSTFSKEFDSPDALFEAADKDMYRDKNGKK